MKVKQEISPLDGLRAKLGDKIVYTQGYESGRAMYDHVDVISASVTDSLRAEAVKQAADADLVIYVGGLNKNHLQDCEAGDRLGYELPFGQNDLIKGLLHVNKKMVMVQIS